MSFFDKLLTPQLRDTHTEWLNITSSEQLDELVEESKKQPVVIFMHSTSCGISHNIKHNLEEDWDFAPEELKFYYLDLLAFRPISNEIARKFNVIHQSPQIIVLKDGEVAFDTSHQMISVKAIRKHL